MALRVIGVKLMAEISDYTSNLRKAAADTRGFVGELDKAARSGHLDAVASQATRMGLTLLGAFASIETAVARFEQAMSRVDAVTDTSADGMRQLANAAIKAGEETQFSATEAARAEEELGKAGIAVSDILSGALAGSLSLAAAGSLELADAADIAAKTMNLFKLRGSDVGHIADVLAAAANRSATDVHELGMALKMGGLAASAAGMSLEETVGTLSAFADRALVGSDAGTSLKSMLLFLQTPTDKATELMKQLGIEVYDVQGNFIGTTKLAGVLHDRLSDLTQEERNAALATIFGADAMRAANVLYGLGEDGVRKYVEAVNDQGAAQRAAAERTNNLMGDIERLTGSLESLAIKAGSSSNSALRVLVQMADMLVKGFSAMPPELTSTAVALIGLTGAALLAFAAFLKLRASAGNALAELAAMGPVGEKAATGLAAAGRAAGKALLAFAALEVASSLLASTQKDLNIQADALGRSLEAWAKTGVLAGEAARVLGKDMQDLDVGLKFLADTDNNRRQWARRLQDQLEGLIPGLSGTNTSLTKTRERVLSFDQVLADLVRGGRGDLAAKIFKDLANSQAKYGVSEKELLALFPQYTGAIEKAGGATAALAAAKERATLNAAQLSGGLAAVVKEAGDFKRAFDLMHQGLLNWVDAEIGAEEALDNLDKVFKENGKTLDVHTEKGRNNLKAIRDMVDAAVDAAQAKYNEELATKGEAGALADANAVYQSYIGQLRAAMIAAGFTKTEVDQLVGAWTNMPQLISTTVVTPGMDTAIAKARLLRLLLGPSGHVSSSTVIGDVYREAGYVSGRRWGGIVEHAQWGTLREAAVYSPQSPARYMMAEPATGGEAFVPKSGDYGRSMSILSQAAGWYGASVVPGGGGGSIEITVNVRGRAVIEGTGVLSGLRKEVDLLGGSTEKSIGRRLIGA